MWVELCFRTAGAAGSKQTLRQGSRPSSEDASGSKSAAAWIVCAEQTAEHFTGHEEAFDVLAVRVQDAAMCVRLDTAECERNPARDAVGVEGSGFDGGGPVALYRVGGGDAPVFDIGI